MDSACPPPSMQSYVGAPAARRLQPSALPLESQTVTATGEFILNPTAAGTHRPSPTKPNRRHSTSRSAQGELGFVAISAPQPQRFTTDSPAKRPTFPRHSASLPSMAHSAFFTTFSSVQTQQPRTNDGCQSDSCNESFADFPEPSYGSRPPRKRVLMDAAPLTEPAAKKQKCDEATAAPQHLPDPQEMPLIDDDGTKPPYSYATLIGMSILRAPKRRLTLAQIYNWISETFSYYQRSDPGWQNSIRHNLSLNKAFVKQERPKDDPGKGNYWTIEPGMEAQFLKDKPLRRATMTSLPLPAVPHGDASASVPKPLTTTWIVSPPPPPAPAAATAPAATTTAKAATPRVVDLSSDATIPASDPALQDEETSDEPAHATGTLAADAPRSSPPPAIHSSPPVAPAHFRRHGTPPTPLHQPVSSSAVAPRSRKRKSITTLNDSGYFSSLESSAMRPNKAGHILTSDIDIEPPRIKRGRAEEEIARIRSSSHDISPRRPPLLKEAGRIPSSPLRGDYISMLPPPLTPVISFKKPAKPPPSVSPNTNLRNHRRKIQQMVNSPLKHLGLTDEDLPWSPAFSIHDESFTPQSDHLHAAFDVFADVGLENMLACPANGSPEKRSVKRARTDSASGVDGHALADITATNANNRASAQPCLSALRAKAFRFPDSPTKPPNTGRYIDATDDDFFSFHLFDDSPGEVDGVDLLQGFQKIGGSTGIGPSRLKGTNTGTRPHLNPRSHTSLF